MLSEFKLSKAQVDDILSGKAALKGGIDLKAARTAFLNKLSDTDLLSASEKQQMRNRNVLQRFSKVRIHGNK
ncbi:MAG: hypothetical protein IPH52_05330 [Leptospiraceae bacterium]|nr:hypothetical protein [Leptospiraceae bacterium]